MSDPTVWKLRDPSQPCEHDIPDIDGFTWQDDAGNWFCDEEGCPGGREIVLRDWVARIREVSFEAGPDETGGFDLYKVWVEVEHE